MPILVIDDSSDARQQIAALLATAGHRAIVQADSATAAFRLLGVDQPAEQPRSIDVILLDVVMPEMDGIETCRRIKASAAHKDIPIIMVTVRDEIESLKAAFAAGAIDYIAKPYDKVELVTRVAAMLSLKREMDRRKQREAELQAANQELALALKENKILRKFLPICAACKKIRNDEGFWQQIESYLREYSGTEFSHSLCEDCAKRYFASPPKPQGPASA